MDSQAELYFWVDRLVAGPGNHIFVSGHDFFEQICGSSSLDLNSIGPIWVVSRAAAISPLSGRLERIHINGLGWQLEIEVCGLHSIPFLLTSNQNVRCFYHGRVSIESGDPTLNIGQAVGDGMPLCGDNWIGVAKFSDGQFVVDAFSDDDELLLSKSAAYCRRWSATTQTSDGSCFHVSELPHPQ